MYRVVLRVRMFAAGDFEILKSCVFGRQTRDLTNYSSRDCLGGTRRENKIKKFVDFKKL